MNRERITILDLLVLLAVAVTVTATLAIDWS